ncbi:probable aminotransferase ACS10 [Triticum dicoccoides]|uniref:probable aminotransferase ACS10 n=1 Tax=Triticum dicoccoides TaxID=85692 RepID=UPI001890C7C5|nr:probable aminotransferase ACS10 [Triticum dicoccoides]
MEATWEEENAPLIPKVGPRINCPRSTFASSDHVGHNLVGINLGEDSLYYAGLRRCAADTYHPASNPAGVIQLELAENHLSLDLVREWMEEPKERDLTISGVATYQPYDGILALKMEGARGRRTSMRSVSLRSALL